MYISKGLKQAYDVQDAAMQAINAFLARNPTWDSKDCNCWSRLVSCWETAQERVRVQRGKPLPGSLSHEKVRAQRKQRSIGRTSMFADATLANDMAANLTMHDASTQPAQPPSANDTSV